MDLIRVVEHSLVVLPLVAAAAYTVLLLFILGWSRHPRQKTRAFSGFIAMSVLWTLLLYLSGPAPPYNLPIKALAAATTLLALASTTYLDWSQTRPWHVAAAVILGLSLLLTVAWVPPEAPASALRYFRVTPGGVVAMLLWLGASAAILIRTWYDYQHTYFPWHANRLLYWALFVGAVVVGDGLTFAGNNWLAAAGHLLRFFAVFGLARAVTDHRLFDVRARLRKGLAFLLMLLASSLPAGLVLLLTLQVTERLQLERSVAYLIMLGIIVLGFVFYQPFRRLLERILSRYWLGQELQTSQVVRHYTQSIARTLDVDQLSLVIIGTISELLETSRGALLLVGKNDSGYLVDPIPAMGLIPRESQHLPGDSPFFDTLDGMRAPLLQYDVDFNPAYATISTAEQGWLRAMAMDVYVPVHTDDQLSGVIALGPKSSGLPYRADELELVQLLADQTVIALQNALLYSELNQQHDRIRLLNTDLRQQNDRLGILDKIKSDFITIASHELRTPLTQVKGYADILLAMNEEAALTQEQTREIAGHITRASTRLESLISAMLDASQLEASGLHLVLMPTRLETVLRLATDNYRDALHQRRLRLEVQGAADLPQLRADLKRLVQAFTNLLSNAIKYTPDHGTITIEAALVPGSNGEEYIEVVIADTGLGIDEQYHELIFEKFFRIGDPELHSTGTTKFKGAGPGLGLHIAKGVVEAHGGNIWVESDGEDEERLPGSRFHVILPLIPPQWEEQHIAPQPAKARPVWLVG